jgi:hypothetical protein
MSAQISPAELQGYAEELFRRAIASTLKIPRHVLLKSPEKQTLVEHCLSSVIAVATYPTLEAAASKIVATKAAAGEDFALADAKKHVDAVCDQLPLPIAGFERMLEMGRHRIEPKDIWDFLRCRVPIAPEYDDDWMRVADAWILHGERILLDLGTANVTFGHISTDKQT